MSRIFITGSTDGLGRAAAETLLKQGHDVVLHARSDARAAVIKGLAARSPGHIIGIVIGDLASASDTRSIAAQVNALGPMDTVIHNAGIYAEPRRGATPEGHATVLAVNTLAPYILTALIAKPRRLITLSSDLHRGGTGPLRDLDWTKRRWDAGRAYAETKLHMIALAFALARRWPDAICTAVDPGWVRTKMGGAGAPVDIDTGQKTQSWLAVSNEPAALESGRYWRHMRQTEPAREASDVAYQDQLLAQLRALTGVALP